eukprot:2737021-Amphidinium_carterae.1
MRFTILSPTSCEVGHNLETHAVSNNSKITTDAFPLIVLDAKNSGIASAALKKTTNGLKLSPKSFTRLTSSTLCCLSSLRPLQVD